MDNLMPKVGISDTALYLDANSLNNLKTVAGQDAAAALPEAAKQFEGLMVNMMVKSMRDANSALQSEDAQESNQMQNYQQMYDQQIAQQLSKDGGFGLAKAMLAQLKKLVPQNSNDTTPTQTGIEIPTRATGLPLIDMKLQKAYPLAEYLINPGLNHKPLIATENALTHKVPDPVDSFQTKMAEAFNLGDKGFSSPEAFLEALLPYAKQAAAAVGIDPRILLAHAALETGWGKSIAQNKQGESSYNLFGIKAGGSWQGEKVNVATHEVYNGVAVKERANFRKYHSFGDSFNDLISMLSSNPRYQNIWQHSHDPKAFMQALQRSGYATDPTYAKKMLQIFNSDRIQNLSV